MRFYQQVKQIKRLTFNDNIIVKIFLLYYYNLYNLWGVKQPDYSTIEYNITIKIDETIKKKYIIIKTNSLSHFHV